MAVDATAASGSGLARDLRRAVAGLERLDARPSQLRLLGLAALLLLASLGYWSRADLAPAILAALWAGLAYALLLISTHEMVHGTCLGRPRLEFALGCLLSWPMAWPFASYASLHRLHHRWNGSDRRDPERVQPLPSEWRRASPLQRWCLRHPLPLRALLLGGIGLILETLGHGWRLRHQDPRLSARLRLDLLAILTLHSLLLTFACHQGLLGRYLLFWLLLERVIGAIVQCRGLIEHHGLWHRRDSHLLTQLYGSRSVSSSGLLNVLMGGLPHHAAHHAFPWIPAGQLPLASQRIEAVLARHGLPPLPRARGYGAAAAALLAMAAPVPPRPARSSRPTANP
jgi:fatty acid desaturase